MGETEVVFETHSTTEDNERGTATGWLPGRLSASGREQASAMGDRTSGSNRGGVHVGLDRAVETVSIACADSTVPVLHDWRLRECDYGDRNGMAVAELYQGREHLDVPYPGGESWRQAVARVGRFLDNLPSRWAGARVLVVGHTATRWALDHILTGVPLDDLLDAPFDWQPGWEYLLES